MNKELELAMIRAKANYYAQDRDLVIEFNKPETTKERKLELINLNERLVALYNMVKKELTLYRALANKDNKTEKEEQDLVLLEEALCNRYDVARGFQLRRQANKIKRLRKNK